MANPNHDERGRFASGSGAPSRTSDARGKDPATTRTVPLLRLRSQETQDQRRARLQQERRSTRRGLFEGGI